MRDRDAVAIVSAVVVVLLLVFLGGGMMGPGLMMGPAMMGGYYGQSLAPWFGILMPLFWVLALGGIAIGVGWLARHGTQTSTGSRDSAALDILKQRYARGEITREQYDQMRRDIG